MIEPRPEPDFPPARTPRAPARRTRAGGTVARVLTVLGPLLGLFPLGVGLHGLAESAAASATGDVAVWLGLGLSSVALVLGSFFFAYAVRYYLGTVFVVLAGSASTRTMPLADDPDPSTPARIRHRTGGALPSDGLSLDPRAQPFISIHIAAYNEKRVIGRLLEACSRLQYQNYEVVVVDDSTDESTAILEPWARLPGFKVLHRPSRQGFKGGALAEALRQTDPRAGYVVVFDADAVPFPDTLQRFLPHFYETQPDGSFRRLDEVAAVQSYQWHVLNKSESWLTQAVRTEYAGSYMVERPFQQAAGSMKMVAGTAYMIRADILRGLGWGRSLTEDWELTLRLYVLGYKVVYTPFVETPAECVGTFPRLARQRMRWAEGHTYNVRKWFWRIAWSRRLRLVEKVEFAFYSTYYLQAALFVVGTACWLVAEIVLKAHVPEWTALLGWSLLFSNLFGLPLMNLTGLLLEDSPRRDFSGVLGAVAISYLIVPFQAWAALKGLLEREEGPWFRTPKTGRITDPVWPLRRLWRWRRRLWRGGPRDDVDGPAAIIATAPRPAPSRRLGWVVTGAMLLVLGGLGVQAARAPVVYANPDQLWLLDPASSVNASDKTLGAQGASNKNLTFKAGTLTRMTWLTVTSYSSGSVAAGNYTFSMDFSGSNCTSANPCSVSVDWGYCNSGCTTLQPAAASFSFSINAGGSAELNQTVAGSAITLSGCPCHFYVDINSTPPGNESWSLGYNGTNVNNDSNITTPTLPAPEHLFALAGLGLILPLLLRHRLRRGRRLEALR